MTSTSTPAPSAHSLSRRNLLAASPVAALLATVPALAFAQSPDAALEAAWQRRQEAYAAYNAQPIDHLPLAPGEIETPEEKRLWGIINESEEVIRSTVARTPRGVSIQLWCCLYHSVSGATDDAAITRGDLAVLSADETALDWNVRLALSAQRSLIAMEA